MDPENPTGRRAGPTREDAKMMRRTRCQGVLVVTTFLSLAIGTGCQEPVKRLNAPPQGHGGEQSPLRHHFDAMTDNAMLADMSMSPVHFVPHSTELNGLGARRLNRYAEILAIYGGTLRYDGAERDEDLLRDRLESIREYLVRHGIGEERCEVKADLAGGEGMDATLAVVILRETGFGGDTRLQCSGTTGGGGMTGR